MSNLRNIYFTQFFHRTNADSTIDSICGLCLNTVASVIKEEELRVQEANHQCSDRGQRLAVFRSDASRHIAARTWAKLRTKMT